MINRLAILMAKRWVDRDIISSDVFDCYVYGWEIILITFIEIANILIVAICTNSLGNAIVFLVTFALVREYTGGYHAETCLRCNVCLTIIYLLNLYLTLNYKADISTLVMITLVSGLVIIYKIGPIENKNKILSNHQKKSSKRISLFLFLGCCAVGLMFIKINVYMTITINITLIEILILMLITKINITQIRIIEER